MRHGKGLWRHLKNERGYLSGLERVDKRLPSTLIGDAFVVFTTIFITLHTTRNKNKINWIAFCPFPEEIRTE